MSSADYGLEDDPNICDPRSEILGGPNAKLPHRWTLQRDNVTERCHWCHSERPVQVDAPDEDES